MTFHLISLRVSCTINIIMTFTQFRSGFFIKASNIRNIVAFRVDKFSVFQSFQFRMSANLSIIKQFRVYRENQPAAETVETKNKNENEYDSKMQRQITYITKQKLDAINYVTII